MKRRRPVPVPFFRSLRAFQAALAAIILLTGWGFVHYTRITLTIQKQLAPGMEHPNDYYATGCLLLSMLAMIFFYLTRRERIEPRSWSRAVTAAEWAAGRKDDTHAVRLVAAAQNRPRRRRKWRIFRRARR